ncbi:WYL domain-containing protein [Prevotella communis]|uniref:helix-turn-helix transcriptional regulator n=1 Tax=Prevotella communis TaxID=2913614 RepID=UPI001EDAF5F5|nr:WYL domain-containing protein [Prevotella communis]UKK61701.1 WYL domain-containing protein [Prevotella communis]UKK64527.1 WYL domain-containing protein [Prevotella communis]
MRYQVLNKCFRNKYREYTIDDLVDECNEALRRADKPDVSKRTVQNDINILEADYGIILNEKLRLGKKRLYRYVDTNYSIPLFRINDEERHKLQDAIRVLDHFEGEPTYDWARTLLMQIEGGLFDEDTSPVVTFQSNPDLKGISYFSDLLQAILTKRVLKLKYTPYGKETQIVNIYPYHLKQFNDRWYLIAQAIGYQSYAHYALDRVEGFEEIALPYKESNVDFSEYFDDVIGVTVPDVDAEDIVIKVTGKRFNYIRTKPLHLSQRIIEEAEGYAIISINVRVNKELESLILSFGDDMKVIAPASFRDRIAEKIKVMNQLYSKDKDE